MSVVQGAPDRFRRLRSSISLLFGLTRLNPAAL